jgi:predicted O-methyltransferase YrrM
MDLSTIYGSHPVCERNILARLERHDIPLTNVTEWSLAIDSDTQITDQNHPGGVQSVVALAAAARISATSFVIDVGAGIGGSARVLAQAYGCEVVGIERDAGRCEQAIRLTALVGLSDHVRFLEHDALADTAGIAHVDVLWGQSAWAHFPSPDRFLDLWVGAVKTGGRIAMADAFVVEARLDEAQIMRELQQLWAVHLLPFGRWRGALEQRHCHVVHSRDRSEEASAYFKELLAISPTWPEGTVSAQEQRSWVLADQALDRGLITMSELVAVKES